jgi:hypothetical protein
MTPPYKFRDRRYILLNGKYVQKDEVLPFLRIDNTMNMVIYIQSVTRN